MASRIIIHIFKGNPNAWFQSAEQTISTSGNSGAWSVAKEEYILTMGSSGTSGCLHFISDTGESFIAAFGVDQNKPWCDTALRIHPQYYGQPDRIAVREKHLACRIITNAHGRSFSIDFTVAKGHHHDLQQR